MLRHALADLFASAAALAAQVPDLYDVDTVRDVHLTFAQPDWWNRRTANYGPEINIPATLQWSGVTVPNVGVRFRGNTSYTQLPAAPNQGWEKKSFIVELDAFTLGHDLYGISHFNFNNGFHDPTFLREPLTFYVMRRHGVAPRADWIRLFLNGAHWGVYIHVEQPNKDMFKQWFRSNDGHRYRCLPTSGTFGNGRCACTALSPNIAASYLSAHQAKWGDGADRRAVVEHAADRRHRQRQLVVRPAGEPGFRRPQAVRADLRLQRPRLGQFARGRSAPLPVSHTPSRAAP